MKEISENELKRKLNNDDYKNLKPFDFFEYDRMVRKSKRHLFQTERDFQEYKKSMMDGIAKGNYNLPILERINNFLSIKDGYVRLITCKLLGIDPVIEVIDKNTKLVS